MGLLKIIKESDEKIKLLRVEKAKILNHKERESMSSMVTCPEAWLILNICADSEDLFSRDDAEAALKKLFLRSLSCHEREAIIYYLGVIHDAQKITPNNRLRYKIMN